jgi:serine/threonine-protein kinase
MDEAKEKLHEKKIGIRQAGTQASDEYPEGQIVSQDIESGEEVPINTTVNVYISSGAGSISVTSVLGISEQEAKNTLTAQGFLVSTSQSYSDTVEEGKVISQTPGGGASAKKGDTVNLVISSGKEVKKVVVPDVVNKGKQEAVNMLTNAGLTVTSTSTDYSDNIAEGNVISQSIAKDQSVDEGTNISLVISLGSRVTKYYCNAPDSSEVKSADITLRDASGQVLQIWSGIDIGKFPYTISVSDIESSDRGTLDITWHLSDGTAQEQHENVTFTKQ